MAVTAQDNVTIVGMYTPTATFNTINLNDPVNNSTMYVARIGQKKV